MSINIKKNIKSALYKYFYLILLIPILFIAMPLFSNPGIPVGNGDLPYIEISLYSIKKLWTWNEYGSYHGLETLPRYPIIAAFQLINILPALTSKLLIVGGFAIASLSFYFSFLWLFGNRVYVEDLRLKIAALLGSLFYAYNVWSFHRLGHWYFWLGYAILPLFFVTLIYAFRNPRKWKYILASVLLWSIASSTPHMAVFFGIIFVGLTVIYVARHIRKNHNLRTPIIKPFSLVLVAYVFINLYWIYPYLISSTSESFLWSAVVTEEITRDLSQESNFLNVFRLLEGTFNMGVIDVVPSETSTLYPLWLIASFVPPIVAFSSILWIKNPLYRYILFFLAVSVIGIFLTMGTNAPMNIYSVLLFHTPLTSYLQILLREPDKWGFLVSFGYSFLIAISAFVILNKLRGLNYRNRINTKNVLSIGFVLFTLSSIIIYFFPAYEDSMYDLYRPITLPDEFRQLQESLPYSGVDRVFITPYSPTNTTWVNNTGTFELYHVSSPVPNIAAYDYNNVEKYHKFLIDSVITNKTNTIDDLIYPLGTSYVLFHNDTIAPLNKNLLQRLSSALDGVRPLGKIGFFYLFKTGNNEKEVSVANIPLSSGLIVGGLHQLSSLSSIDSFNSLNYTLSFLDQKIKNHSDEPIINNSRYVVLDPNANNFVLSFIDDEFIIEPFHATNHHEPDKLWSKAGADDPGNAWFTPYLEFLGMQNSDFDYGKGLVMTEAMGAKLSIPFHIEENGDYEIFMRYLHNQKGGMMKVYLDNMLIDEIYTRNAKTNNDFIWKKIAEDSGNSSTPFYLGNGKHTLTLENVAGLNAVNLFAVIPPEQRADTIETYAHSIANATRNIYVLEAESSFYNNKGRNNNNNNNTSIAIIHPQSETIKGQIKVPSDADLAVFTLSENDGNLSTASDNDNTGNKDNNYPNNDNNDSNYINNNNSDTSGYRFKKLELFSTNQHTELFRSDFEIKEKKMDNIIADFENKMKIIPLANLRQTDPNELFWGESELGEISNTSIDSSTPISGNSSLKVDIKKGNTTNWNIISTDFIGLDNESLSIEAGMAVSAKDVNQLHSKIVYFDDNKKQIASEFFFGGRDGTFKENFTDVHILPPDAKYVKMQVLVRPNPTKNSSYIVDDTKVHPISAVGIENWNDLSNTSIDNTAPISGNSSLKVDIKKANTFYWSVISTDFIPVDDQSYYELSLDVSAEDVTQLHPKISYYDKSKKQLTSLYTEPLEDTIFPGTDGDFRREYKDRPLFPLGTKYVKLEILTRPNPRTESTYSLDDIKLKEIMPKSMASSRGEFEPLEYTGPDEQEPSSQMRQLKMNVLKGIINNNENNGSSKIIYQTKPIPVEENGSYNFTIAPEYAERPPILKTKSTNSTAESKSTAQLPQAITLVADFGNSSDVIETSDKYGARASSGGVLSLSPGSEIYSELEILKAANYTIALRASRDSINSNYGNYSINNSSARFTNTDVITNSDESSLLQVSIIKKGSNGDDSVKGLNNNYVDNGNNSDISNKNKNNRYNYNYNHNDNFDKLIRTSNISLSNNKADIITNASVGTNEDSNNYSNGLQGHRVQQDEQEFQWLYLNNTYLSPGNYEIRISPLSYSESAPVTDLDLVVIYSADHKSNGYYDNHYSEYNKAYKSSIKEYQTLDEVFDSQRIPPPAYIEQYRKINPTKYEVQVKNATRPYVMSLAESYDPLWTVHDNNRGNITTADPSYVNNDNHDFQPLRVPLYSIINGFYINKTGDYTLTIEYEPQKLFTWAGIISTIAIVSSVIFLTIQEKKVRCRRYIASKGPVSGIISYAQTTLEKGVAVIKRRR